MVTKWLDHAIDELLGGIADVITTVASNQAASLFERIPGQRELAKPAISAPEEPPVDLVDAPRVVSIDIDLRFRDLKAAVPIFTSELSYVNSALIRPIVAFIKYAFFSIHISLNQRDVLCTVPTGLWFRSIVELSRIFLTSMVHGL